jgi:predicted transglutaminase-like protease
MKYFIILLLALLLKYSNCVDYIRIINTNPFIHKHTNSTQNLTSQKVKVFFKDKSIHFFIGTIFEL